MRTAVYCVSKNGYETCLKIRNNVYKNLHIYVSQRVVNMLNLESENVENLFVINERVPILLEKTFDKYDLHIFVAATGAVVRIIEGKFKSKDTDPAVITVDDHEISKIIPKNIILGIGCKRNTPKEKIIEKINYVMETQNLEMDSIKKAASAWVKSDEIGLLEAMTELNIPIEFFEKEKILEVEDLVEERSEFVKNQIGVYGVSEPCAYLASSRKGSFLVKKVKMEGITISIFEEEM